MYLGYGLYCISLHYYMVQYVWRFFEKILLKNIKKTVLVVSFQYYMSTYGLNRNIVYIVFFYAILSFNILQGSPKW